MVNGLDFLAFYVVESASSFVHSEHSRYLFDALF